MLEDIIPNIKKTVVFICLTKNGKYALIGTGFYVSVHIPNEQNFTQNYLVTAKHVLQDENDKFYPTFWLRVQSVSNELGYAELDTSKTDLLTHDDNDVDIVAIPVGSNLHLEYLSLHEELIATKQMVENLKIHEGDDMFFAGLFSGYIGQKKNQPIIRSGKVALISDEKIAWKYPNKPPVFVDLYLMDCYSFGGNSGSPVFFNLENISIERRAAIGVHKVAYLAGVISGHFNEKAVISEQQELINVSVTQNSGIAAVTPAYKLHEILFSKKAEELRAKAVQNYKKQLTSQQ